MFCSRTALSTSPAVMQGVCPGASCSEVGKKPAAVENAYRLAFRKVADAKPAPAPEEEAVVAEG